MQATRACLVYTSPSARAWNTLSTQSCHPSSRRKLDRFWRRNLGVVQQSRRYLLSGSPFRYDGHVPTSTSEKIAVAVCSAFLALHDPTKGEMVAALGDSTGALSLRMMRQKMTLDAVGSRVLHDKPLVTDESVCITALAAQSAETFGGAYGRFMQEHDFSPDRRPKVHFVDDVELAYVMRRYRQVHDFWHVLNGVPPTEEGEIALKCVELIQTGLPVAALSTVVGPVRLEHAAKMRLMHTWLPWAISNGLRSTFMLNIYYEELLDKSLDSVRAQFNVRPAPL